MEQLPIFNNNFSPLQTYPGKKAASGAAQQILSQIPKCSLFIDVMSGSGLIASLVKSFNCEVVLNDIDKAVIDQLRSPANNVTFSNKDYRAILSRYDNGNSSRVFFIDPPYLIATRNSQRRLYNYDWELSDHKTFLKRVKRIKCPTIIVHYSCDLYDKALKGWRKITYNTMTRGGVRQETLYMNFPQPVLLQCFQLCGKNFTDRQRIKRKVDRLITRLTNESDQERAAILSAIVAHFTYVNQSAV